MFQYLGHLLRNSTYPQSSLYIEEESSNRLVQPTTAPNQLNKEQTAAALQLLALLEGDEVADANASIYGRWHEHLADQLSDEHIEDLGLLKPMVVDLATR